MVIEIWGINVRDALRGMRVFNLFPISDLSDYHKNLEYEFRRGWDADEDTDLLSIHPWGFAERLVCVTIDVRSAVCSENQTPRKLHTHKQHWWPSNLTQTRKTYTRTKLYDCPTCSASKVARGNIFGSGFFCVPERNAFNDTQLKLRVDREPFTPAALQ